MPTKKQPDLGTVFIITVFTILLIAVLVIFGLAITDVLVPGQI